ncbi:MAG: hypothetical protein JKY19_06520 [Alcanivoracaceae bacterium]|nr:hypothetical protein [Alcanivoracaceae bacterium]
MIAITSITKANPLMIAHAGGGIDGKNYSNSLEAINLNYSKGFRYFEIDFSWTKDEKLVCIHDWQKQFKKVFAYKTRHPLSAEQFQSLLDKTAGLHPCTLTTLGEWLEKHEDAKIITDIKSENIKALGTIIKLYPHLSRQFIPQFYQPYEYKILKSMGFKQLIWILYQYQGAHASVVIHAQDMKLFAISMKASQAKKAFAQQLIKDKNNVFVYTINKQKKLNKLVKKYHVSGIYTDFLSTN